MIFPRATALCLRLLSSPLARAKLGEIGSELAEDGRSEHRKSWEFLASSFSGLSCNFNSHHPIHLLELDNHSM
jgi:hypothetical protein